MVINYGVWGGGGYKTGGGGGQVKLYPYKNKGEGSKKIVSILKGVGGTQSVHVVLLDT